MKVCVALLAGLMALAIATETEAAPCHRRGRRPIIIEVEQNQTGVLVGDQTQVSAGGNGSQSLDLQQTLMQNQTVNISGPGANRYRNRIQVNQDQSAVVVGNQTQIAEGGGSVSQSADLQQELVQNQFVNIELGRRRGRGRGRRFRRR